MIDYILTYLLIGVGFCSIIDIGNGYYESFDSDHVTLNNIERLLLILIWPVGLVIFVILLIKNYQK